MTQLDLIAAAERQMADTSLDQWDRIKCDLPLRDLQMVAHVDDYLRAHQRFGYTDVTGRELADWLRRDCLSVRPALTRCKNAGWLTQSEVSRKSRHPHEGPCEPYAPALPREAVDRAIREASKKAEK